MSEKINDLNYERKLADALVPVVLNFGASFCGPTAYMIELVADLREQYAGKVIFYSVDIETCPHITRTYQVKGVPAMIMFKKGEPVASRLGTCTYEELVEWMEKNLTK